STLFLPEVPRSPAPLPSIQCSFRTSRGALQPGAPRSLRLTTPSGSNVAEDWCRMATSPADVIVGPPPKAGHDREVAVAVVALFVLAIVALAVLLVRTADDPSPARPATATTLPLSSLTTVTPRPAPPPLRLGPARPDFVR